MLKLRVSLLSGSEAAAVKAKLSASTTTWLPIGASTGVPFYEPNPNTGAPLTLEFPSDAVVATNTVWHERSHASRVIAPVVRVGKTAGPGRVSSGTSLGRGRQGDR